MYSARDEDESSSDSDTSSKLSESETTDLSDDSNTDDDLDNIIVDKAVIEVPADRSEKSSDDDSEKEKERARSRSPVQRNLRHGDNIVVSDDDTEEVVAQKDQVSRDKEIRGHKNDAGFKWVAPKRPTKSYVWNQFGFKKFPNKRIDYNKVYCKLCDECKNYLGTPTNMKHHLLSKHAIDASNNEDSTQPKAKQYFMSKEVRTQKYPKKHPVNIKSRNILVKWICKRNRPFLFVEDPEFSEFCRLLDEKYQLPSRKIVTKDIEETYKREKEKLMESLKKVPDLYATNDGGSAINGESFLSYTIHYVDPETWELKDTTLGCTVMKEIHTAKNYRAKVDEVEKKFDIKGKVFGYTTDNLAKMHKAFENDARNGCIAHIQSKTMQKAVESVECVSKLRSKLRKVAKLAKFSKFKYALEKSQKKKNLPTRKVLQEVKTRFTSTLTMFHSVMSHAKDQTTEVEIKKAKLNIEAINEALEEVGTKKSKKLKVKPAEADIMIATAKVLEPICEMLTMLGGEKYVTGGIVLPYMKKIVYLTRVENTDLEFIGNLKRFINQDFLQRCRENLNFDLCKKATFLDARFKSLKSIESSQREVLKEEIMEEMKKVKVEKSEENQPDKYRKKVSLESDSDEDDFTASGTQSVKKELQNYIDEPKLLEDSDPLLDFWKLKGFY